MVHIPEPRPPAMASSSSSSTSSVRALGAVLLRKGCSHGFSSSSSPLSRPINSIALRGIGLFGGTLAAPVQSEIGGSWRVRRIWTTGPLCMGRRSCKIAGRKGAQNAKKMKRNTKIGKEIVSAIKKGGPNPNSNTVLAAVLEKAKQLDIPKEIVERNLKKALDKGQEAYIEKVYEIYGFGGVSMVIEVLTDKITRSVQVVRNVVKDCGAKMADSGSVTFKFKRAQVINIKLTDVDKDKLLEVALDAGAEDVIEPTFDEEEDSDEDLSGSYYKVVCSTENFPTILSKLQEEGIHFEPDSGFELLPLNPIEVDDEAMDLNKDLISKLLELDDVDAVYSDQKY